MPPRFGGAPKCPRCQKSVYMAEQVLGPGGPWHNYCLTCKECNKRLDSTTLTEKDNEAYCKTCYNRTWGPKGYGFAGGAAFLSTENKMPREILEENYNDGTLSRSPSLPSRTSPPLPARPPTLPVRQASPALPVRQHNSPSLPSRPPQVPSSSRPETQGRPVVTPSESEPYEEHQQPLNSPTKPTTSGGYIKHQTSYVPRKFNFQSQQDTCVGCGKTVYAAELVLGAGNKYHKMCLKCCQCGKRLDSTNMADRDFDLYCKGCYSKSFGPKGFGFSNLLTPEGATR